MRAPCAHHFGSDFNKTWPIARTFPHGQSRRILANSVRDSNRQLESGPFSREFHNRFASQAKNRWCPSCIIHAFPDPGDVFCVCDYELLNRFFTGTMTLLADRHHDRLHRACLSGEQTEKLRSRISQLCFLWPERSLRLRSGRRKQQVHRETQHFQPSSHDSTDARSVAISEKCRNNQIRRNH